MADGPVSRIEWVEEQLRRAILSGELKPGERLLTAQLSERFSVSPTPLHEALHRFAGEGLVEFVPQCGARVTALSPDNSAELRRLWGSDPHDARDSETAYRTYYEVLTSTCGSNRLRHNATVIRDQDARYRMATIDAIDKARLAKGHQRLMKAALAGHAATAGDVIRTEIEQFAAAYRTTARAGDHPLDGVEEISGG